MGVPGFRGSEVPGFGFYWFWFWFWAWFRFWAWFWFWPLKRAALLA